MMIYENTENMEGKMIIQEEDVFAVNLGTNNLYHVRCAPCRYEDEDLLLRSNIDEDCEYICDACGEPIA